MIGRRHWLVAHEVGSAFPLRIAVLGVLVLGSATMGTQSAFADAAKVTIAVRAVQ